MERSPQEPQFPAVYYAAGHYPNYGQVPVNEHRGVDRASLDAFRSWAWCAVGIQDADPNQQVTDPSAGDQLTMIPLGALYSRSLGSRSAGRNIVEPIASTTVADALRDGEQNQSERRKISFDDFCQICSVSPGSDETFDSNALDMLIACSRNGSQITVEVPDTPEERSRPWMQAYQDYLSRNPDAENSVIFVAQGSSSRHLYSVPINRHPNRAA